jgi:hypothetical protein
MELLGPTPFVALFADGDLVAPIAGIKRKVPPLCS